MDVSWRFIYFISDVAEFVPSQYIPRNFIATVRRFSAAM